MPLSGPQKALHCLSARPLGHGPVQVYPESGSGDVRQDGFTCSRMLR